MRHALLNVSPVVIGIPWFASMDQPASGNGMLTVDPASGVRGGHCVALPAFDGHRYRLQNSWGTGWAANGSGYLAPTDVQTLLDQGGEMAAFTLG